jgi:hypothetical protein
MKGPFLFNKKNSIPDDLLESLISAQKIALTEDGEDKTILLRLISHIKGDLNLETEIFGPQELTYISNAPRDSWAKYLIFRYKFKIYPLLNIVSNFPIYILIEPVSSCNFKCPMCFQVDQTFTKKPFMGLMNFDFYCNIIDQAKSGGTGAITLASRGEPTLHPRLDDMLKYASGKFYELKLNTNASKLSESLSHKILSSGVTNLIFSVDWHEKIIYEKLRKGGNFEEILKNITKFHQIRDEYYPNSKLVTRVSGVKVLEDQNNIEGFKDFWSKITDEVTIYPAEERWDTYSNSPHPELTLPCNYLWERFYIWFDGICNPCDVDYKSLLSPGKIDLNNTTIKDIWKSKKFEELRNAHKNGNRLDIIPCDRCGVKASES